MKSLQTKFIIFGLPFFVFAALALLAVSFSRGLFFVGAFASALAIVLGITVMTLLARNISKLIKKFIQAARAISKGNFDYRLKLTTKDETGDLALAINKMAEDLKQFRPTSKQLDDIYTARSEATQERSKALAIIKSFPEGLLFFNEQDALVSVNPKAEEFFEMKFKELIGKNFKALEVLPWLKPLVDILSKENSKNRIDLVLKNGLALEVSTINVVKGKEEAGTLVVLRNITREKVVERLKTEFVSIAAHQLRTPISAIKWILRMIMDEDMGPLTSTQRDHLEKAYSNNERMIKLVNDLLNITRIEEGRFLYKAKRENIINVIEKAILPLRDLANKNGISFRFSKPRGKTPNLSIDKERIALVVQNLVENAIHYTKEGRVEVVARFSKSKNEFLFSVSDTGIGIPKDQQPRVFSRFFRGSNAIKTKTEGTGLGLFIAKNIVEAHGGRIWFECQKHKCTTFYFSLPLKLDKSIVTSR